MGSDYGGDFAIASDPGSVMRTAWLRQQLRRGEVIFFLAFNFANALNFIYLVSMGPLLGEASYGLFAALFGIVYLLAALGNTVQVWVAAAVAQRGQRGRIPIDLALDLTRRVGLFGLLLTAGALALSPAVAGFLHTGIGSVLPTVVAIGLSVMVALAWGVLQGSQRFMALGVSILVGATVRLAFGAAMVGLGWGVTGAMVAVVMGYIASGLAAIPSIRRGAQRIDSSATGGGPMAGLALVLVASAAMAFPASVDVGLAEHFFAGHESSLYASAAVLGKAVLFGTLAVPLVLLPKVANLRGRGVDSRNLLLPSLTTVAAVAAVAVLLISVGTIGLGLSPTGIDLSGSSGLLVSYLTSMGLFSVVAVFIYFHLGRGDARYMGGILVPGIILQVVALLGAHQSPEMMARVLLITTAFLLLLTVVYTRFLVPQSSLYSTLRFRTPRVPP